MIKIIKDAFKVSFENIILATPLLVFLLLLNVYLIIAKNAVRAFPSAILFFLTLFLMISTFLAGWFYMVKKVVSKFVENKGPMLVGDKGKETFNLLKEFPVGIADYMASFMGFVVLFLLVADISFMTVFQIGMKYIGSFGVSLEQFIKSTESPIAMQALLSSMSQAQLVKLNYWYLLAFVSTQVFALFTMFWPIEILYTSKNPIKALFLSIKRIFTRPLSIVLFILIILFYFVMTLLNYISMYNAIAYFIMTLVYFYFIVFIFVLLFLYYEQKIKSYSNSITDSDGQE